MAIGVDERGEVDIDELKKKAEENKDKCVPLSPAPYPASVLNPPSWKSPDMHWAWKYERPRFHLDFNGREHKIISCKAGTHHWRVGNQRIDVH